MDEIKCRICLKYGIIPIYGANCKSDLSFDVRTFGDIDVFEDDEYPKYLCSKCLKLLQCAILFRNTAKRSDSILKYSRKQITERSNSKKDAISNPCNLKLNSSTKVLQDNFKEATVDKSSETPDLCNNKLKIDQVQCSVCHKTIGRRHAKSHYDLHDPGSSKYICDICGKAFRQRSGCLNHRKIHSTEFKYKCNLCPYRANIHEHLKIHGRIHEGDYRCFCTKCPAKFLTKSNFNKHYLKKHTDPQLKCDYCKKGFHFKTKLKNHIQSVHLGLKTHLCDICGDAFSYRKSVLDHQLKVHKRKNYLIGKLPAYLKSQIQEQKENQLEYNNCFK